VSGLASGVSAISAFWDHTCAVKDGGAWCWGDNVHGQLGNDSTTASPVPVAVSALASGVTAISVGTFQTCALKDGGALCWGANVYGQLGTTPVPVPGLASGVTAISVNNGHICALKEGGAWCWGTNVTGQLGNNSTTDSPVPVPVSGLASGVTGISAGGLAVHSGEAHSCALKDGGAWCWGYNIVGQLGDWTTTQRLVPVSVVWPEGGTSLIAFMAIHDDGTEHIYEPAPVSRTACFLTHHAASQAAVYSRSYSTGLRSAIEV
jgi:alpha-tubulin suppressor-like RCC1 family protein